MPRTLIVVLMFVCLAIMLTTTILAIPAEPLGDAVVRLMADPWGRATFADLATGFVISMCWMWHIEERRWTLALWWPALWLTGNFAMIGYVLLRCANARPLHHRSTTGQ